MAVARRVKSWGEIRRKKEKTTKKTTDTPQWWAKG